MLTSLTQYEKIELLISAFGSIILAITLLFVFLQVKVASKTLSLDGMLKVNEIFRQIGRISKDIYSSYPPNIVMTNKQFSKLPPFRHKRHKITEREKRNMVLTDEQKTALASLTKSQKDSARELIGLLNDVGQLAEDGCINYDNLLGKYHTIIIRLSLVLEPIRREIEFENNESIGGNYGQRLLRLRYKAILYNRIHPKHREVDIKIYIGGKSKMAIEAEEDTVLNKLSCLLCRFLYIRRL